MDRTKWIEPRFALLAAGFALAVLYGSLYPFRYRPGPGALQTLLATTHYVGTPVDVAANILFYIPLGLLIARAIRRPAGPARIGLAVLGAFLLSTGIELAQAHIVGRLANLSDVYANSAGGLLGASLAWAWPGARRLPRLASVHLRPFPLTLLAAWLAGRTFGYGTPLNAARFAGLAGRLFDGREIQPLAVFHWLALWLAAALLIGETAQRLSVRYVLFAGFIVVTGASQLLFGFTTLSAEELWAASGAMAVMWMAGNPVRPAYVWIVAILVTADVITDALRPFDFVSTARAFGMKPFSGFLSAPRASGITVLFQKIFAYGALVWVWMRAGWSWRIGAIFSTLLVLALRILEIYLPGRSAEITDAILVLGMACVLKLLREDVSLGHSPGRERPLAVYSRVRNQRGSDSKR